MTKQQALDLIKLLSALESWGLSTKNMFPDCFHEDLYRQLRMLEKIVLEEKNG